MKLLDWIDQTNLLIGRLVSFLLWVGAAVLVWEVISRYVFDAPTIWAHGYTQRIFGAYFIMLGAFTLVKGGHVRVDLFLGQKGSRHRALLDVVNYAFLLVWGLAMTSESWRFFQEALRWNQLDDSVLAHPLWPVKLCIVIGAGLISAQALAEIIRALLALVAPRFAQAPYKLRSSTL
jgi:TRAP-type mannitol/chloroaromatic compound transport system permease small subunit